MLGPVYRLFIPLIIRRKRENNLPLLDWLNMNKPLFPVFQKFVFMGRSVTPTPLLDYFTKLIVATFVEKFSPSTLVNSFTTIGFPTMLLNASS